MWFPFYRNRDFLKSGTLISIRRTGDGFHPGLFSHFWENHYVFFISQNITIPGGTTMRKKNYKGRCEKKSVPKCNEIFKAYDAIQNQCHLVKLIGSSQFEPLTKNISTCSWQSNRNVRPLSLLINSWGNESGPWIRTIFHSNSRRFNDDISWNCQNYTLGHYWWDVPHNFFFCK